MTLPPRSPCNERNAQRPAAVNGTIRFTSPRSRTLRKTLLLQQDSRQCFLKHSQKKREYPFAKKRTHCRPTHCRCGLQASPSSTCTSTCTLRKDPFWPRVALVYHALGGGTFRDPHPGTAPRNPTAGRSCKRHPSTTSGPSRDKFFSSICPQLSIHTRSKSSADRDLEGIAQTSGSRAG